MVQKTGTPVVLVLNKIDLVKHEGPPAAAHRALQGPLRFRRLRPRIGFQGRRPGGFAQGHCGTASAEGPAYFPEDHITDQPERFLAAELVREKVLLATRQEVPHSVTVTVDRWQETPGLTKIFATIRVEREGQKTIVIGTKAATLKRIGTLARVEMERLFGAKVYLDLHVRVQPEWREQAAFLNALDWRTMAGEEDDT